jgi:hypothetical protein
MNGVSILEIIREQFYSKAPDTIARPGVAWLQIAWLIASAILATGYGLFGSSDDLGVSILAANAIFTALSVTMAMFFWPRAINLKNDAEFAAKPERWHVYRLTTQLFWTVLVGILATGLAVVQLAIPDAFCIFNQVVQAVLVGLTIYQVLLLGQCVFRLYAATFWMPRA